MKSRHVLAIRRGGFTLVELLVVMGLIALLATLMIGFFPGLATSARESRGAMLLQSWLNIAKQRALRDQTPIGVRLLIDPANPIPNMVGECQYISQPDDFCFGKIYTQATPATNVFFNFGTSNVDLVNGYPLTADQVQYWAVQPGDFLEVSGSGLMYRVVSVVSANQITITPPLPNPIGFTAQASYRVVRGSRALGDEPLKLPDNTFIDLNTNDSFSNPVPYVVDSSSPPARLYVDILFAPSGQVISRGLATDKIHLWVRVPNVDFPNDRFRGDPTLVSIFARSGFVGAFSPDPTNAANPYSLVK